MSHRLTLRQQAFVDAVVSGKATSVTDAARIAGYANPHPRGAETVRISAVARAIEAKSAELRERAMITAASLMRDLHETAGEAREVKQYGAAVSAYGKLLDKVSPDLVDARVFVAEVPVHAQTEEEWALAVSNESGDQQSARVAAPPAIPAAPASEQTP